MQQEPKLKIKEAENVIDSPVNKEMILERLSAMSEDIMFVRKEIENGSKNDDEKDQVKEEEKMKKKPEEMEEDFRKKLKKEIEKGVQEEMMRKNQTFKNFQFKEMKKREGFILKEKWKVENDPKHKLKKKIQDMKVKNLVENFIKKISMNGAERDPVDFSPFEEKIETDENLNEFEIPSALKNVYFFISIMNIMVMLIIASVSIVFEEPMNSEGVTGIQIWGALWMVLEAVVDFVKVSENKINYKRQKIRDIVKHYVKSRFFIDLICFVGLAISIIVDFKFSGLLRLTFLLKIPDCLEKIETLERKILNTSYKENCWGLVKIFMSNFMFAHVLAVILIMITWLNSSDNWLSKVNAIDAVWYEQYSWAYYWGTTIMLTIGFGDISPVNFRQALFLVVIEAFSCIILAYNINCVGVLFSNIRAEDVEKVKKQKTLKNLSEKNNISQDLTAKISNYIEECCNIKKNFDIDEELSFISSLPSSIKTSFLRESNKKIFDELPFFQTLTQSTLLKIAEKIEMTITHPEQVIEKKNDQPRILILKQGSVAFCTRMRDSNFNNTVIDSIEVKNGGRPLLLSLEFINPLNIKNYQLVSKEYSIINTMDQETLKTILKEKDTDLETFFYLKDKSKHVIDEFQIEKCDYCSSNHLKFRCPKLHYMPLVQGVIYKYLQKTKINLRQQFKRKNKRANVFFYYDLLSKILFPNEDSYSESLSKKSDSLDMDNILKETKKRSIMKQFLTLTSFTTEKIEKSDTKIIEDTVSTFKNEIMFFLNEEYNWFWTIETDIMKDYKNYFLKSNPKELKKMSGKSEKKKKNKTLKGFDAKRTLAIL